MYSVSIVTYHTPIAEVRQTLQQVQGPGLERVYVVDNGRDEAVARVCAEYGYAEYMPSENVGYGRAHNQAIELSLAAGTRYHLVMNTDLQMQPCDLQDMLAYMDNHDDVGCLHPRIIGLDGSDQYTVRMLPTPFDLILRRFLPSWLMRGRRDKYLLKHLNHDEFMDVPYVQGSFMLMRTSTLRQSGVFDERYFMYPEDIDLSRRIMQYSRVVYFPYAKVVHAHRAQSYKSLRMLWVHMANMVKYFNKWGWFFDSQRRQVNDSLSQAHEF